MPARLDRAWIEFFERRMVEEKRGRVEYLLPPFQKRKNAAAQVICIAGEGKGEQVIVSLVSKNMIGHGQRSIAGERKDRLPSEKNGRIGCMPAPNKKSSSEELLEGKNFLEGYSSSFRWYLLAPPP